MLSENRFQDYDKQWYESQGETLTFKSTGAYYYWTPDSDEQMISTDSNDIGREMTGGNIINHSGNYTATGSWDSNATASVVFDLKNVYSIERVDIFSTCTNTQQLGEIRIAVSENGVTYTDAGVWQGNVPASLDANGQAIGYTQCDMREMNARYVKVSCKKASVTTTGEHCYQLSLGEIVILGGDKKLITRSVGNIKFTDGTGERLFTLKGASEIFARAEVTNQDAVLVSGCYSSDGRLNKVFLQSGKFDATGASYTLEQEIPASELPDGSYLKSFVFDSLNNIRPLTDAVSVAHEDVTKTDLISGKTSGYKMLSGTEWVKTGDTPTAGAFSGNEDKLFDEDTNTLISSAGGEYANIKINFDSVARIEKISVYANTASGSDMASYDVYASTDGVNYEYIASASNSLAGFGLGMVLPVDLQIGGVVYASDIKIVAKKLSSASVMELSEIEVFGRPAPFRKEKMTSYTYEQEVPFNTSADIVTADASRAVLSDGNRTGGVTSSGDYVSVIYDLGTYCSVEDIKAYGTHSGLEVLLSPDGVNYTTVGFYPNEGGVTNAHGKANTNARYAKLVFRKGSLSAVTLQEVELYARKLYDENETKNTTPDKIPIKVSLKPNNVMYVDWTSYNEVKNGVSSYKLYIEPTSFSSTTGKTLKQVYVNGGKSLMSTTSEKFCTYAGLEPDKDYYVAVVPADDSNKNVTPVKIHTYSALGGEKLSAIFCINEYPYGGGAHIAHPDEQANLNTKLKLISDMEVFSKTRYWGEDAYDLYLSRGLINHQYARSSTKISNLNNKGMYTFATANEPDLVSDYVSNPALYVEAVKNNYNTIKSVNSKNLLCDPSLCGTDKLAFLEQLYQADANFGSYYDVFDIHAYCKAFEGKGNLDDNLSSTLDGYSAPEHIFAKTDKIRNLLAKYNDANKDIIFTEVGWATHNKSYGQDGEVVTENVTKEQQANYVARCYIISAMLDVKNVFLYAFQDEGTDPSNKEEMFGIVDWYGNPKPAYYSYYTLGKLLRDAKYVNAVSGMSHPNYGAVFYDEEKDMYLTALWNASGTSTEVTINSTDASMLRVDMYGNSDNISNGRITIGSSPVYIYSSDMLSVQ
ncbi:MAG: discoidin domain-containing protein [Clostridiales bacterium]|nr:discoidin domain-containing protein [Clostridiales bacterium]